MKLRIPDCVFPHTAGLEIPLLDITKQAQFVDLPVRGWGQVSRRTRFRGTWHFYVADSKFTALWKRPDTVLNTKAINAVEPNFSTDVQMQYPTVLYRTYQKRWLARYWQYHDLGIWVDLNVAPTDKYNQLNLEGVPRGWKSYATRARDDNLELLEYQASLAEAHSGGGYQMMVYSGGPAVAHMCEIKGWVHVRDAGNKVREAK
jgi:hypothetical protein